MLLFCCLSSAKFFCGLMDWSPPGPLSMGFPRQEYWSRLPFASPGDLPDPGIEPMSPALEGGFFTTEPPGRPIQANTLLYFQSITSQNPVLV